MRDVIETSFLVDYLSTYPAEIDKWRRADQKKRTSQFGAARIRSALDKRDGYTSGERKRIYGIFSEYATHASYPGVTLMTTGPANMAQVGPFFDDASVTAVTESLSLCPYIPTQRYRSGARRDHGTEI